MEPRANYVLVGAFVLAAVALLGGFVYWLAGSRDSHSYTRYAISFQESVSGLSEGSIVRYRGIQVGRVVELGLDPTRPAQVRVLVDIVDTLPVRAGTTASLKFQGVTGLSYIELTGSEGQGPEIEPKDGEDYAVIPSTPSAVEKVMASVPELIDRMAKLTESMNRAFSEDNIASFSRTLSNLQAFSDALVADRKALTTLVGDASGAMRGLTDASDRLSRVIDTMDDELIGAVKGFRATTAEAQGILEDNRESIADFSATSLSDLSMLFISAQSAAARTDALVDRLKGNPSQLVFPPKGGGVYLP